MWLLELKVGVRPENETKITFDFPGGTVADLLNKFVAQYPDYRWREEHGAIHVFRKEGHVSLTDGSLSYPGSTNLTRLELWLDLYERPEIRAWMNSTNCRPEGPVPVRQLKPDKRPISIAPGSITVAQLLDEVAHRSGANYWAVLQSPPSRRLCHVSVITW
jgi:hypothetical protein